MDINLDTDEEPLRSCVRSDEFELIVPKVFEISPIMPNTNGLYLILVHGGLPHFRISFGAILLLPRHHSKAICLYHNSSVGKCNCLKLLHFLETNDNLKLRREVGKRNYDDINIDSSIDCNKAITIGAEEGRLLSNQSRKPRPLQNPSDGHTLLTIATYTYLMDTSKEIVLITQKGCSCALVESRTGITILLLIF